MKRFYFYALLFLFCIPILSAQPVVDGDLTDLGPALVTQTVASGFGTDNELNAFYGTTYSGFVYIGIAGDILNGNRMMFFIDNTSGSGLNTMAFDRTDAPSGLNSLNSGNQFDASFFPDYCLTIGEFGGEYFFDLYTLDATTGSNIYLGSSSMVDPIVALTGLELAAMDGSGSGTMGFELKIPSAILDFGSGSTVRAMAMISSDGGFLSDQFFTPAAGPGNFGSGVVDFNFATNPKSFVFNPTFPVELFDFSGAFQSNSVALTWTAAEELFSHYEVERLSETGSFEKIDRVVAEGEFGQPTSYQYLDHNAPLGQVLTYRLAMVDMDGSINYSNQIEVNSAEGVVSISPNPTYGQLTVALPGTPRNPGTIHVMNMQGQTVYAQTLAEGQSVWNLDLSDLASGAYQAVILWDNQRTVKRFSLY